MALAEGRVNGIFRMAVATVRGAISLSLFLLFGVGALLIAPLMVVLRDPRRCQPVVRATWRLTAWMFEATGLIRVKSVGLDGVKVKPSPSG